MVRARSESLHRVTLRDRGLVLDADIGRLVRQEDIGLGSPEASLGDS